MTDNFFSDDDDTLDNLGEHEWLAMEEEAVKSTQRHHEATAMATPARFQPQQQQQGRAIPRQQQLRGPQNVVGYGVGQPPQQLYNHHQQLLQQSQNHVAPPVYHIPTYRRPFVQPQRTPQMPVQAQQRVAPPPPPLQQQQPYYQQQQQQFQQPQYRQQEEPSLPAPAATAAAVASMESAQASSDYGDIDGIDEWDPRAPTAAAAVTATGQGSPQVEVQQSQIPPPPQLQQPQIQQQQQQQSQPQRHGPLQRTLTRGASDLYRQAAGAREWTERQQELGQIQDDVVMVNSQYVAGVEQQQQQQLGDPHQQSYQPREQQIGVEVYAEREADQATIAQVTPPTLLPVMGLTETGMNSCESKTCSSNTRSSRCSNPKPGRWQYYGPSSTRRAASANANSRRLSGCTQRRSRSATWRWRR